MFEIAELIIGDFPTFFVLTWTIPSCRLLDMEGDNNDENELSFIRLAAATANIVRWLEANKQQAEHSKDQPDAGDRDEQNRKDHRCRVDQRLRD